MSAPQCTTTLERGRDRHRMEYSSSSGTNNSSINSTKRRRPDASPGEHPQRRWSNGDDRYHQHRPPPPPPPPPPGYAGRFPGNRRMSAAPSSSPQKPRHAYENAAVWRQQDGREPLRPPPRSPKNSVSRQQQQQQQNHHHRTSPPQPQQRRCSFPQQQRRYPNSSNNNGNRTENIRDKHTHTAPWSEPRMGRNVGDGSAGEQADRSVLSFTSTERPLQQQQPLLRSNLHYQHSRNSWESCSSSTTTTASSSPSQQSPEKKKMRRPSRWGRINTMQPSLFDNGKATSLVAVEGKGTTADLPSGERSMTTPDFLQGEPSVKNNKDMNRVAKEQSSGAKPHLGGGEQKTFKSSSENTVETTDLTASPATSTLDTTTLAEIISQGGGGGKSSTVSSICTTQQPQKSQHPHHHPLPTNVVVMRQQPAPSPDGKTTTDQPPSSQQQQQPMTLHDRIPRKKKSFHEDDEDDNKSVAEDAECCAAATITLKKTCAMLSKKRAEPPKSLEEKSPVTKKMKMKPLSPSHDLSDSESDDENAVEDEDDERSTTTIDSENSDDDDLPDCNDSSLVSVGARVAVFWDGEGEYFSGTVAKHSPTRKKPFYVKYDDGDREWMNFELERFRLLSAPSPSKKKKQKRIQKKVAAVGESKANATKGKATRLTGFHPDRVMPGKKTSRVTAAVVETLLETETLSDVPPAKVVQNVVAVESQQVRAKENKKASLGEAAVEPNKAIGQGSIEAQPLPPSPPVAVKTEATTVKATAETQDWVAAGVSKDDDSSDSDSETDDEELMQWASKMFGIPQPVALTQKETKKEEPTSSESTESTAKEARKEEPTTSEPAESSASNADWEAEWAAAYEAAGVPMRISEKVKLARRKRRGPVSYATAPATKVKRRSSSKKVRITMRANAQAQVEALQEVESKRKKEEARPLTAAEISAILGEECFEATAASWVRRSVRQPSKSALTAPRVKSLLEKLSANDSDMVVLKMKKYCSDLDTPQIVIDAVLDALEENKNCESLYIQNFNEGMRDEQVLHLLKVLQRPSCKIWCLNIGETYKVSMETWEKFAEGLKDTKITHMYASEHTITTELKDKIRETIRLNRSKHSMHSDPNNLETIIQCTHCWWNPINTKSLRPYLKTRGYEHILNDAEAQGLMGTMSGAELR